ncbi:MAG TPA: GGDEF domain-containing protein [Chitinivibrionales bacterium]|jgi:diguanylate cyclase (GGDEF)-like protein|nr:GGDEF domain-containing protein [Chitinivibrionales bacterium]
MENQSELPFEGFKRFVQEPLEADDPLSFDRVKNIFLENPGAPSDPFRFIVQRLTGKTFQGRDARDRWQKILSHKTDMQAKLGRPVTIGVAAADYFDVIGPAGTPTLDDPALADPALPGNGVNREEWINRAYEPGYHLEKLKEEMMRAKRYRHALSALLLDVDHFHKINLDFSFKTGDEVLTLIVKIIKKTVRAVDIVTRYSGDRFLIILPNTNRREACELAERLRANVGERTGRIKGLSAGVTATLAAGQSSKESASAEFMKSLECTLEEGKKKSRNAVYICEGC